MAADHQLVPDSEESKRQAKREYLRQYHLNRYDRVSRGELPLFAADPLREGKLGWTAVIVCRLCGLKLKKLPQHLWAEHQGELRECSDTVAATELALNYRKRFGYDKRAPLMSKELVDRFAQRLQTKNSRRRHKGKRAVGFATRFRRGPKHRARVVAAADARQQWGTSPQTKQKMSTSRKGRSQPKRWRKVGNQQIATDWNLASLRLDGKEQSDIAAKCGLTRPTVTVRLQRIGFPPGKPCRFFRGEPVTEKRLRAHYDDLKFVRVLRKLFPGTESDHDDSGDRVLSLSEVAALLKVPKEWVYGHTSNKSKDQIPHSGRGRELEFSLSDLMEWAQRQHDGRTKFFGTFEIQRELANRLGVSMHRVYEFLVHPGGPPSRRDSRGKRRLNHPLSLRLADRLLASEASLRQEVRHIGAEARGGRPRALLPSEQRELAEKYRALARDMELMLHWAELQEEALTDDQIGDWMCQQSRARNLRILLFWPNLHDRLPAICERARYRMYGGGLGSAERAKELICHEYGISRPQLVRAINVHRSEQPAV